MERPAVRANISVTGSGWVIRNSVTKSSPRQVTEQGEYPIQRADGTARFCITSYACTPTEVRIGGVFFLTLAAAWFQLGHLTSPADALHGL